MSADKQSQYERKMARQRQMELMEAAASGTAPAMELDTSSFAQTDGSYRPSHITGERPVFTPTSRVSSSMKSGTPTSANIFDHRREEEMDSMVNLMDHDTGIYKEDTSKSNFLVNTMRRSVDTVGRIFQRRQHEIHDASPAEAEFIGDNPYGKDRRASSVSCTQLCAPVKKSGKPFLANRRRRRFLVSAFMATAVLLAVGYLLSYVLGREDGAYQKHRHHVQEKVLRQQNTDRFNTVMDYIISKSISHIKVFQELTSPEYHALRWVAYSDPAKLESDDPMLLQRYALAVFFYSSYLKFEEIAGRQAPVIIGEEQWEGVPNAGWIRKDYWLTEKGHCQWYGVTCEPKALNEGEEPKDRYDANEAVVSINITANHVVGKIPPELKALDSLKSIDLSHNRMQGSIPREVSRMFQLEKIYLHHNRITGKLPDNMGFWEGLQELRLSHNMLTGTIPSEINRMLNLHSIAVDNNMLTGTIPELKNLQKMTRLYLDHNKLDGKFPYSIVHVTALFEIHLNDNQLSGTIPAELETLRHLRSLHAENNKIVGSIPHFIFSRLRHLRELALFNNGLTGPLPKDMGSEPLLELVQLNNNRLTGSIPVEWDNMTSIELLHLQENNLIGPIPSQVGTMTTLRELWLNNNGLTGALPDSLGQLTALKTLYIEHNGLRGRVPSSIGYLEELHSLRMFDNDIKGYIPDDVCELTQFYKLKNLAADCALRGKIMKCDCCTKCY